MKKKRTKIILVVVILITVLCMGIGILSQSDSDDTASPSETEVVNSPEMAVPTSESEATKPLIPTPTEMPATAAPTPNLNLVSPGTHIVGKDIQPGLYRGQAGEGFFDSCYWSRLKNLSGEMDAILANDNAIGQYYFQVLDTDFAVDTACEVELITEMPQVTDYPTQISPGTYLVNNEIKPGMYQGQAGADFTESCYWSRLSDLSGNIGSITANDNAMGKYYIQVNPNDIALNTACPLEWIGE